MSSNDTRPKKPFFIISEEHEKEGYSAIPYRRDRKLRKKFTVKQWKKFLKKEEEKFDTQMYLLRIYHIILTDYKVKRKWRVMCPTPLNEKLKMSLINLPSQITPANLDKALKAFDKGVTDFTSSMDAMTSQLGGDKASQKKNLKKLWGKNQKQTSLWGNKNKKGQIKIFSDKKKKKSDSDNIPIWSKTEEPRRARRKKSDKRSQGDKNLEKLWGKRK